MNSVIILNEVMLKWLERSSRPKAMNIFYKNSFTHSNLKTDMTAKGVLNIGNGKNFC